MSEGHLIRGSVRDDEGTPIANAQIYYFNQDGEPVGSALTDGNGDYVSPSGLPDGTYFAATNRAAVPADDPLSAEDAEAGVGRGLRDEIYGDIACAGICAPSLGSGIGTPIEISGADATGIYFVLEQAPGIDLETLTNGVDADTPNGGDAPQVVPGTTVTWTYRLSNTGGEDLQNIAVVDDQGVTVSCPASALAAGATMDCTGNGPALNLAAEPFEGVIGNCGGEPN
jgi:uncharacterized repeat protein (TIGR01451 family)